MNSMTKKYIKNYFPDFIILNYRQTCKKNKNFTGKYFVHNGKYRCNYIRGKMFVEVLASLRDERKIIHIFEPHYMQKFQWLYAREYDSRFDVEFVRNNNIRNLLYYYTFTGRTKVLMFFYQLIGSEDFPHYWYYKLLGRFAIYAMKDNLFKLYEKFGSVACDFSDLDLELEEIPTSEARIAYIQKFWNFNQDEFIGLIINLLELGMFDEAEKCCSICDSEITYKQIYIGYDDVNILKFLLDKNFICEIELLADIIKWDQIENFKYMFSIGKVKDVMKVYNLAGPKCRVFLKYEQGYQFVDCKSPECRKKNTKHEIMNLLNQVIPR